RACSRRRAGGGAPVDVRLARLLPDTHVAAADGKGAGRDPGCRSSGVAFHTRRHRLLLMKRLVFLTQSVDPSHPVLAATIPKIRALAARVEKVVVLAQAADGAQLPDNVEVRSFGAATRPGRFARF